MSSVLAQSQSNFQETHILFEQFKKATDTPSPNVSQCNVILANIKEKMMNFSFYNPLLQHNDEGLLKKELLLSREVLEIATLLSVKSEDIPSFIRNIAQLKTFYYDIEKDLPESQRQWSLLGLNLLFLLSENLLSEFHTELELIPSSISASNIFVKYPIKLEQYLMEGAYNKIVASKDDVPAEYYRLFVTKLVQTVRDEIASCIEKSHTGLSLVDAQRHLMFTSPQSLIEYTQERGWAHEEAKGRFVFDTEEKICLDIPSRETIFRNLMYAKELDRIV